MQKKDESGSLINGAVFALFKVDEDGRYLADDGTPINQHEDGTTYTFNYNETASTITTSSGKTITSCEQHAAGDSTIPESGA